MQGRKHKMKEDCLVKWLSVLLRTSSLWVQILLLLLDNKSKTSKSILFYKFQKS